MEDHRLEGDFCVREKGESAVSDFQLCSFYTGYGILPENINLSVIKTETLIPCIDRVPISQETRTLLQILCNHCLQHPFKKCFVSFLDNFFDPLPLLFSCTVSLLTSSLMVNIFSYFLQTLLLCFFHVWLYVRACTCCKSHLWKRIQFAVFEPASLLLKRTWLKQRKRLPSDFKEFKFKSN